MYIILVLFDFLNPFFVLTEKYSFPIRIFRIKHPIAVGLAIGNSAHALGTSRAMEIGELEGAMSSLAVVVAGIVTVLLASIFSGLIS